MTKATEQTTQTPRRGIGRRVFIPLALATAIGGFAIGMVAGPLVASSPQAGAAQVVAMHAGTFPLSTPGAGVRMVDANVSIRADRTAPDGPGPLRDAVHALLTEAAALPLVQDGRDSLADLERVVLSMAEASAPWLVALDLEPAAGLSTAALAAPKGAASES